MDFDSVIADYGARAKTKFSNPAVSGQPEEQLRSPFDTLLGDLAELIGLQRSTVAAIGESALSDLKIRPDYAVAVQHVLVGNVELKAPG